MIVPKSKRPWAQINAEGTSFAAMIEQFPDDDTCLEHIFRTRFGPDYLCTRCGRPTKWWRIRSIKRYGSNCCGGTCVSPLRGTIFAHSSIPLTDWFHAMLLFANSRNGVASHFIQRHIGFTHKAAWRMCDRIRTHMALLERGRIVGGAGKFVHVDEALIRGIRTAGVRGKGRAILFGMCDREAVTCFVVENRRRNTLMPLIQQFADPQSTIVTDDYGSYRRLSDYGYKRSIVKHSIGEWVNREGITQSYIEQYWAVLKRAIRGTHLHVERKNLWKYIGEFNFRFNRRRRSHETFWDMIGNFPDLSAR